jgi:hypothetical protein
VRLLASLTIALTLAAVVGLGATWHVTTRGISFGTVQLGVWEAHPKSGTSAIDPYARAIIARSGELPLGSGDGLAFLARYDGEGRSLDGRCDVVVSGLTPLARYWTITLHDLDGRLVANPLGRYGFTSQELTRRSDGAFDIVVAPRARSGNWLPSGGVSQYLLVLRLYDTPVGLNTRSGADMAMPSIKVGECA